MLNDCWIAAFRLKLLALCEPARKAFAADARTTLTRETQHG